MPKGVHEKSKPPPQGMIGRCAFCYHEVKKGSKWTLKVEKGESKLACEDCK